MGGGQDKQGLLQVLFLQIFRLICLWINFYIIVDCLHLIFRVLDCIECSGPRTFLRDGFPCVRYTNHYFLTGVTNLPS